MQFDLNYIIDNYRKIANVVFVVLVSITLALITGKIFAIATEKEFVLESKEEAMPAVRSDLIRAQRSLSYYSPIVDRNIFDSQNRQPAAEEKREYQREYSPIPETPEYSGPPVKSSMNATLVGTMVFSDPSYSFAKIAKGSSRGGDSDSFYIGDSLFGEATVKKIERNRVFIKRDGRTEYLEIEGPRASVMPSQSSSPRGSVSYVNPEEDTGKEISDDEVRKIGENKYVLDRKMVDSLLSNYNEVLTQARAVPNFTKDGKANGFKLFAIRGRSIYSAIGIKNGDVLTRVNGNEINNLERVLALFTQLRNDNNITIDLERGDQKITYEYEIK